MNKIKKNIIILILSLLIINIFSACKTSYPKEKLPEIAKEKIKKEANYDTDVFLKGTSLYVIATFPNSIPPSLSIPQNVFDIIQNIILTSTNIALSTDANIEFFVIVIKDPANNISLTFKQNLIDIKKWFYGIIGREDFFQRSLTEIKYLQQNTESEYYEITKDNFIMDQTIYILKGDTRTKINEDEQKLEKEGKSRVKSIKETGTIPEETAKNIQNLIQNIRKNKILEIYLASIVDKKYSPKEKNFEYTFKRYGDSENNLLQINYDEFGELLAKTNLYVCDKYEFKDCEKITIKENDNIVFSFSKPLNI